MRKRNKTMVKLHNNQSGMVSITITLVIMIIVTLLVSSFALIVRREQRQTLDRQLSTQAFYAAESGLEDARSAIKAGAIDANGVKECDGPQSFTQITSAKSYNFKPNLSSNVEYSCVLIDMQTENYKVTANPTDGTFVVPISTSQDLTRLRINWQNTTPPSASNPFESNLGRWPSSATTPSNSLKTAALRVTVLPGFRGGTLSRDKLRNESHTMFLYPGEGAGNPEEVQYLNGAGGVTSNAQQGRIVSGKCDTTRTFTPLACAVDITNLTFNPSPGAKEEYYLVIRPLYHSADIEIQGLNGTNEVALEGAQAVVDVTGRAEDVLRRVQARLPIGESSQLRNILGLLPDAALETRQEICKMFEVNSSGVTDFCTNPQTVTPNNNPPTPPDPGNGSNGDADISTGDDPNTTGSDQTPFQFRLSFRNISNNPSSVIAGCTWYWGHDNRSDSYPASQCEYGDWVNHEFPNTQAEIIRTNGDSGCRRYTVRLVMRFTAASGLGTAEKTYRAEAPVGQANDNPNGICYRKYDPFP